MTGLAQLVAGFIVFSLLWAVAFYALPVWFNTAVLAVLIVAVVVGGLIKLVLVMLTPPGR